MRFLLQVQASSACMRMNWTGSRLEEKHGNFLRKSAKKSPIILQKFEMVKEYLAESWGIDIDKLHKIVQEREQKIGDLDLGTL